MSTRSTEVIEQITKIYDRVDGDGVVTFLLYIGSIILTLLGLYFLIISTNLDFVNEGNSLGNRGRFVGGTAGSIWAFAGVLLFIIILRSHNKEYQLHVLYWRSNRITYYHFNSTFKTEKSKSVLQMSSRKRRQVRHLLNHASMP